MTFPKDLQFMKEYKKQVLDTKSASFCGAKWYHGCFWLWNGWTASCHHNPPHVSNLEEVKLDPGALHNTDKKKQERAMMQQGQRPLDCQFCWVLEDQGPDELSHRTWYSQMVTEQQLQQVFEAPADQHVIPKYVELCLDRTCNLACSYCCSDISTSWSRDIKQNGPYQGLITDERNHYTHTGQYLYGVTDPNPYSDAFFQWWDSELRHHIEILQISGGEPIMSQHFWKLLKKLKEDSVNFYTVIITTNLSYDTETLDRYLVEVKDSRKLWKIAVSNECVSNKSEYVRDGLEWNQFQNNFETLLNCKLFKEITLLATVSAASIDGFVDFLHWVVAAKKRTHRDLVNLYISYVRWPTFQNMLILPFELRQKYSQDIENFATENSSWFSHKDLDSLLSLARYLVLTEQPHRGAYITDEKLEFDKQQVSLDKDELQKDFKRFFTQYDVRRNKNFVDTFPNLKQWYESIQI
jgi:organic radical activating enzyme